MLDQLLLDPFDQLVGGEGIELDPMAEEKLDLFLLGAIGLELVPDLQVNGLVVDQGAAVCTTVINVLRFQRVF